LRRRQAELQALVENSSSDENQHDLDVCSGHDEHDHSDELQQGDIHHSANDNSQNNTTNSDESAVGIEGDDSDENTQCHQILKTIML
jgi:hypothetical protein